HKVSTYFGGHLHASEHSTAKGAGKFALTLQMRRQLLRRRFNPRMLLSALDARSDIGDCRPSRFDQHALSPGLGTAS
ncbi:hypothetical protein NKJ90_33290, partial [Mesorhizobium sp. M0051]|uniref:hypothetical protein n=1 Tax=Mesorhizobium sp. M0051 TaxID=2956862 RepID=UPI00333B0ED9